MSTWWQGLLKPVRWIRSANQIYSLGGTRTEGLRKWDRHDAGRKQLIVFVHGFNSSKDDAWGSFPALLMDDLDFSGVNLHRFGYPTEIVGQVSDIQDQGELLGSFLKETLSAYRSTVMVGHSMGGLVILHALLSVEGQDCNLVMNADIKVLTFGTPYLGVQNTSALQLLFNNKQTQDMGVLSKELSRLVSRWKQRFNQIGKPGERGTPQVPLYAYYGIEDGFVLQASACGGPVTSCEPVDGDHITLVKPLDREHLAYQKLKAKVLGEMLKVRPTTQGKTGIWVAKIDGDEATQAQRSLVQSLEFHVQQEPELSQVVEVRELPAKIAGETLAERSEEAERLAKQYDGRILIWGQLTRLLERVEFHPRVTLVGGGYIITKTSVLPPITEASRQQTQLNTTTGTVSLPSEPLKETLQLARFAVATSFFDQRIWNKAADQFETLLASESASAWTLTRVSILASLAHIGVYEKTKNPEALIKARDRMPDPLDVGKHFGKLIDSRPIFIEACSHLLHIYRLLVEENLMPLADLQHHVAIYFQELVSVFEELKDLRSDFDLRRSYGRFLLRLNQAYHVLAKQDLAPVENLQRAVEAARKASDGFEELKDWENYATAQELLGESYLALVKSEVGLDHNFRNYWVALKEVVRLSKELQDWKRGAWARIKLGIWHENLADTVPEHDPQVHLERARTAYEEVLQIAHQNEDKDAEAALSERLHVVCHSLDRFKSPENPVSS